jgi:hypothetical protein
MRRDEYDGLGKGGRWRLHSEHVKMSLIDLIHILFCLQYVCAFAAVCPLRCHCDY